MKRLLLLMFLTLGATACGPRFHAMTTPPPGRKADLTEKKKFWGGWNYKVRITEGTVLAMGCDCARLHSISTDNPQVAAVMKAHATSPNALTQRESRVASLVVVGVRPGTTNVRIRGSNGTKVIPVVVERAATPISSLERVSAARR